MKLDLYELAYPIHLSMDRRFWTLQAGDLLLNKGDELLEVKTVRPSPVPGERPTIHANPMFVDAFNQSKQFRDWKITQEEHEGQLVLTLNRRINKPVPSETSEPKFVEVLVPQATHRVKSSERRIPDIFLRKILNG